ncbi:hypothetical protein LCGC14_1415220 [marine sediment metagenome]|uniref:Uncharacterized protein n=1 Tax=marine sediment metagenome TaxID=412755 RepID=A0A0F9KE71_9ZZZZ
MAMKHVRIGEVDTPEEVAREINKVIDSLNHAEAKLEQLASGQRIPSVGEIAVVSEDGQFYAGIVTEVPETGFFEIEFFDGDAGCYGVEDLVCNIKKGAEDA